MSHVVAMVVIGAATHQVSIHDTGFIDESATAHFQVELAFGDRRHPPSFDTAGVGRNLDPMANTADRLVGVEEMAGNADQVSVVSDVLWSPATGEEDPQILFGIARHERRCQLRVYSLQTPE